jgi:hypothetical protein
VVEYATAWSVREVITFQEAPMRKLALLAGSVILSSTALLACSDTTPALATVEATSEEAPAMPTAEVVEVVEGAPSGAGKARARVTTSGGGAQTARPIGDAPPPPTAAAMQAGAVQMKVQVDEATGNARIEHSVKHEVDATITGGVKMEMNVNETTGSHSVSASIGGLPSVRLNVNVEEGAPPPPPASRAAAPSTCKAAVLAYGHAPAHRVHCGDDVDDRCAVELLKAGHAPGHLVHCSDVEDVSCAVQILRSGKSPSQIVHCD